jgi:hypothetical protein
MDRRLSMLSRTGPGGPADREAPVVAPWGAFFIGLQGFFTNAAIGDR